MFYATDLKKFEALVFPTGSHFICSISAEIGHEDLSPVLFWGQTVKKQKKKKQQAIKKTLAFLNIYYQHCRHL